MQTFESYIKLCSQDIKSSVFFLWDAPTSLLYGWYVLLVHKFLNLQDLLMKQF